MKPLDIIQGAREALTDRLLGLGHTLINVLARAGDYQRVADIPYGPLPRQRLDYYQSLAGEAATQTPPQARPVVLFFYGGNWQFGEKHEFRFVADTLCRLGCDVVVADYHLYPQARFGQMMEDAVSAGRWVAAHTPASQPIFIMGHSSGAQLGALLCLNRDMLDRADGLAERLQGFVGMSGPYDFYPFTQEPHPDLFKPEADYPLSQPVNFVRPDAPPLYLLHGEDDTRVRRGHSKSLMEKARAVGGRAARETYKSLGHKDIIVSFSVLHRRNRRVISDIQAFLHGDLGAFSDTATADTAVTEPAAAQAPGTETVTDSSKKGEAHGHDAISN